MHDYSNWASWVKGENNSIKLFIHKLCDEKTLTAMFSGLTPRAIDNAYSEDGIAKVIDMRDGVLIYRSANDIYCIPAKPKPLPMGIIDNGDGTKPTMVLEFEYPCEMKREDLVEY